MASLAATILAERLVPEASDIFCPKSIPANFRGAAGVVANERGRAINHVWFGSRPKGNELYDVAKVHAISQNSDYRARNVEA